MDLEMLKRQAEQTLEHGDDNNHTVASAVITREGEVVTGLNLHHFTGGPCAEVSTLANAISQGKKELIAIIAVGNNNRGVVAPCGRCRQILFDYYPDIEVVLTDNGELFTKSIKDLLPHTYDWQANQSLE